ncbi:MAG: hypothetical protein ACRDRB_23475, partial [Pseudonocardiaceae bacterium]
MTGTTILYQVAWTPTRQTISNADGKMTGEQDNRGGGGGAFAHSFRQPPRPHQLTLTNLWNQI